MARQFCRRGRVGKRFKFSAPRTTHRGGRREDSKYNCVVEEPRNFIYSRQPEYTQGPRRAIGGGAARWPPPAERGARARSRLGCNRARSRKQFVNERCQPCGERLMRGCSHARVLMASIAAVWRRQHRSRSGRKRSACACRSARSRQVSARAWPRHDPGRRRMETPRRGYSAPGLMAALVVGVAPATDQFAARAGSASSRSARATSRARAPHDPLLPENE